MSKHEIVAETAPVTLKPTVKTMVKTANATSARKRIDVKKEAEDRFVEPLYERQPRFEGGIRLGARGPVPDWANGANDAKSQVVAF